MKRCAKKYTMTLMGILLISFAVPAMASATPPFEWTVTHVDPYNGIESMSCPTESLCVGADWNGNLITSTNPTGGAGAWSITHIDNERSSSNLIVGVSCPSESLCVAFDYPGDVLTSTNPTGGANAWTVTPIDETLPDLSIRAVSCASESLCVAIDEEGDVLTSTNPTGGSGAWAITQLDIGWLGAVSCVQGPLCVVTNAREGYVAASTNPTGGADAWTAYPLDPSEVDYKRIYGVSCPSASLCVGVGDELMEGEYSPIVMTSNNPTEGADAWTTTKVPDKYMFALSCPTVSFCVASGELGYVTTSTNPTGNTEAWTSTQVDDPGGGLTPPSIHGMSCASESLCVGSDEQGNVVTGSPPAQPEEEPSDGSTPGNSSPGGNSNSTGPGGSIQPQLIAPAVRCIVPKLKGKPLKQAKKLLRRSHCRLGKVKKLRRKHHHNHKKRVVRQKPGPGKIRPAGTKVSVVIG